eukprot:TRINITY_DN748_c0_g1_i1.p1 TRINITY_DN748_c0_g1~~TRINITY_DN748_c0_g1_i1.p1  ORF type:complete len:123 (-),score=35.98 TRINITY_DN748_c0_g1_i1:353-673(-)
MKTPTQLKVEEYFNFVLDSNHVIDIGSIVLCTLGHGFEGHVISHEFYGTQRVIETLKTFDGWQQGLVILNAESNLLMEERKPRVPAMCSSSDDRQEILSRFAEACV